ncbi:hypothetical protein MIND_01355400 [Mycena indigotica]|uniref:CxC5 like cysteine cluster associated with KDZ domain-containing protein n=1 Tax=Mycena indigotica TaxID=2126181 RepID=A0A8H6S0J2_9AGAR|nr:uncharacterized protein MIND_01355400 [Mycena indigotica]KAF7289811.1 hypothetical protein MIND_01355400 [Mycena indigotica]
MAEQLTRKQATQLLELISLVKPQLQWLQKEYESRPPLELPQQFLEFFKASLSLSHDACTSAWLSLRDEAWAQDEDATEIHALRAKYLPVFLRHGIPLGIGKLGLGHEQNAQLTDTHNTGLYSFEPPHRACKNEACSKAFVSDPSLSRERDLDGAIRIQVTVFTKEFGAIPDYSTSRKCPKCSTRYYPNYFVDSRSSKRAYYPATAIVFMQISTHYYMSREVAELFASMQVNAWTSGTNCAKIYNESMKPEHLTPLLPAEWGYAFDLDVEKVWSAFFLHALLLDAENSSLEVEHNTVNKFRLTSALLARNQRMAGTGQAEWNHACEACTWYTNDEKGNPAVIRSCVTDGKAMFQLKRRLERLKISQPHSSMPGDNPTSTSDGLEGTGADEDEDVVIDENGVCPDKPETGNQSVRARFGRRRTHNEELCVASCGVILGRATFYGSEAPNGVRAFWKRLFPTKRSLPQVLWHDNNCRIVAMLKKDGDSYFSHCALPVDVFHFKCKHKEGDVDCGQYCNPYIYSELRTQNGQWRFNSSAAEQTNAWFGGFQAIVQEMSAERYDFFLDEMIRRRNISLVTLSRQRNQNPHNIPREALLDTQL